MASTLPDIVDSVSTTFDVVPSDLKSPTRVLPLPTNTACLLTTETTAATNWLSPNAPPPSHFLRLRDVGYVCVANGSRLSIAKETGCGYPVEFDYKDPITCIGAATHERVQNVIVVCTPKRAHMINAQLNLDGEVAFLPHPLERPELPTEISALQSIRPGKVILGGANGMLYEMRMELSGALPAQGFDVTVTRLQWEVQKLFKPTLPITQILVDPERELAYAVNSGCEVEVLSFATSFLADRPRKIAFLDSSCGELMGSFAVLPKTGYGGAALMGVSLSGKLCYFSVDCGARSSRENGLDIAKRAKTWCGLGLKENMKLIYKNEAAVDFFEAKLQQGTMIHVVSVMQTTIYLAIYTYETGMSTLWELRNGAGDVQYIQEVKSISVKGKILGMLLTESLKPLSPGVRDVEKLISANDMTLQHFYAAARMKIYTDVQYQEVCRRWPNDHLSQILDAQDSNALATFLQIYGTAEACATLVGLWATRSGAAEELLVKNEDLLGALKEAMMKYLKRIVEPVWLREAFTLQNKGTFMATQNVMIPTLPPSALKLFGCRARRLASDLGAFLIDCHVEVYEGGAVHVSSSSQISQDQARDLVAFRVFAYYLADVMTFMELLHKHHGIHASKCVNKDLYREISNMSTRDFIFFVVRRRPELTEFIEQVKGQPSFEEDSATLSKLFDKNAQLLGPVPNKGKEMTGQLSPELKGLRREIRALNERLGQFSEAEFPDAELRLLKLCEHYTPVFTMLHVLVKRVFDSPQRAPVIKEVLQFVKLVQEIQDPEMRSHIIREVALSPLGDKRILSLDPVFEARLKELIGIDDEYPIFKTLTEKQIEAIQRLLGYYEDNFQYGEAGNLCMVLATRDHCPKLSGPSIDERLNVLERGQRLFGMSDLQMNVEDLKRHLLVQKAMLRLLEDRYANYEKDMEDEQLLQAFNVRIIPGKELREMARAWLADDDDETRAAFGSDPEFKSLEELLEACP